MPIPDDASAVGTAEDLLARLGVPHDPAVVAARRVPLLKRFRDLLRAAGLDAAASDAADERAALLARAYRECRESPAVPAAGVVFVPLSEVLNAR